MVPPGSMACQIKACGIHRTAGDLVGDFPALGSGGRRAQSDRTDGVAHAAQIHGLQAIVAAQLPNAAGRELPLSSSASIRIRPSPNPASQPSAMTRLSPMFTFWPQVDGATEPHVAFVDPGCAEIRPLAELLSRHNDDPSHPHRHRWLYPDCTKATHVQSR